MASSSSGPCSGIQPWQRAATRWRVTAALPPSQMGIGCWIGLGSAWIWRALKVPPSKSKGSPLQCRGSTSRASSSWALRLAKSLPTAWNSPFR